MGHPDDMNTQAAPGKDPALRPVASGREAGILTLVLWFGCALIGGLGLALPYGRPQPTAPPPEAEVVQHLQVDLTQEPTPEPSPLTPDPLAPPPPPDALALPSAPQLIAVAQANAASTFALPVEAPARVVKSTQADYSGTGMSSAPPAVAAPSAPQQLTFGEGEGKQLAPPYPRQAVNQGQEGTVVVRLVVNAEGKVQSVEAVSPSPWPLLNQSALHTVLERWRFRSGPPRVYEVPVRFKLTQ